MSQIDRVVFTYPTGQIEYVVGGRVAWNDAGKEKEKIIHSIEISPTSEVVLVLTGGYIIVIGATPFMLYGKPNGAEASKATKKKAVSKEEHDAYLEEKL